MKRLFVILLSAVLTAVPAVAQFYNGGSEPAHTRWYQITTQDYKLVYPEGLDSLAKLYAARLESVKLKVGSTAGYAPNQLYRKPLPVVLHSRTALANGMVAWTPKRMELYTTPDFQAPLPQPWMDHLTIHESRHVCQMQFGREKRYWLPNILVGQIYQGALDILYGGPAFYEGDAVAAETELSSSGRGRNAAFLEYYRAAFREGDTRDWWKWRYGSLKYYVPDHYTIGYITMAGMRSVYDVPDFTARYYQRIVSRKFWPWPVCNFQKTVRDVSGKKFREAFREVTDTLVQRWSRDEAARAPFQPATQLTPARRHYTDYYGTCVLDSLVFSIRKGTTQAPEMVCFIPGKKAPRAVSPFAFYTSALKPDQASGRLWWSEVVNDTRWDMVSYSEIWYSDARGRRSCLKKRTRWYNPAVSSDGKRISVVEYPEKGGSVLLVVDASDATVLERVPAPDGMQLVESEWIGNELYACAIDSGGQGIYDVRSGFRKLLDCGANVVKQLSVHDGRLYFVSDLDGVDELYRFSPADCSAVRLSSTPVGSSSYAFLPDGQGLCYSMLSKDGRHIYSTPLRDMPAEETADFSIRHVYEFAEQLSAGGPGPIEAAEIDIPAPKRYNKLSNAFRIHSWAPLYIDYDAVEEMSFDALASSAGLGATAFFQNDLSSLQGTVAYNASYSDHWAHKAETKLTYNGLYPVIEAGVSVSSDPPYWYFLQHKFSHFAYSTSLTNEALEGLPSVNASLRMYVPLSFSSGGWYRGIVPQLNWNLSNNIITRGQSFPMNRVAASLRAYIMKATPSACTYPKLGTGLELGWSGRPGAMGIFNPNAYLYSYAYFPGLMDSHGTRLSAMLQRHGTEALFSERYASVMPRGMGSYSNLASQMAAYPLQSRFTLDYVFPFAPLDWSGLGPVAYVRNLECTLHGDYSCFGGSKKMETKHIGGVGAELCVVLGNILWIPYATRLGVKYYYNLGIPSGLDPHQFDLVFSVDM